jgi:hypothetical protein
MMALPWECGSEFHFGSFAIADMPARYPWSDEGWFGGSGRDALRALLHFGQRARQWQRLWFPSYFCQKVLAAVLLVGLQVRLYHESPFRGSIVALDLPLKAGDAVLIPNYFGLRAQNWLTSAPKGVELIEDHSHDLGSPWAWQSTADWCIASLRKTLPIADGGVIWSPRAHRLPPIAAVTQHRQEAAAGKLSAMTLKGLYLAGHPVDKQLYRDLSAEAEQHIADDRVSGMTPWSREMLNVFPQQRWRRARRSNHEALRQELLSLPRCRLVLPDEKNDDGCPFSAILLCDTSTQRDQLHAALVAHEIYPAVLWPMDSALIRGIPDENRSEASRMLSISCDHRYSSGDMHRIAALVQETMHAALG